VVSSAVSVDPALPPRAPETAGARTNIPGLRLMARLETDAGAVAFAMTPWGKVTLGILGSVFALQAGFDGWGVVGVAIVATSFFPARRRRILAWLGLFLLGLRALEGTTGILVTVAPYPIALAYCVAARR
jgi:hypothetical protein